MGKSDIETKVNSDQLAALASQTAEKINLDQRREGYYPDHAKLAAIIREALQTAHQQQEQFSWQPIASAPKDGTSLLMFTESQWCVVAYWDAERESWFDGEYDQPATHWRPLPLPPMSTP
jgi:hypothetical protein